MEKVKMELTLTAPLQGQIAFDAEGAKAAIESLVAPYHGLVVTDDNVKEMEDARKELTSYRTRIDKFRKDTKREAEAPIKAFEASVFDILKLITDEEDALKGQLQKYEDARIASCREKVMTEFRRLAEENGLRPEYHDRFGVPKQLLNKGSYTGKGELTAAAFQTLLGAVKDILATQNMDDERQRIIEMNRQSVGILCQNLSEKYSLNTPVTPSDLPPGLVENCAPQELEERVKAIVAQRAEVELRAAEAAALAAKAQAEAEAAEQAAKEERVQRAQAAYEAERQAVAQERQERATDELIAAMGGDAERLYTVTLTLRNVPGDVVAKLKAGKKLLGCSYEMEVI